MQLRIESTKTTHDDPLGEFADEPTALALRRRGFGVFSPAEVVIDGEMTWERCMRADIKGLCDCDALALLPGWERSRGAHLELHLAHRLGLAVTTVAELLGVEASAGAVERDVRGVVIGGL